MNETLPFKIVDQSRQNKYGVVVSSLQDLIKKAQEKFHMTSDIKIVLENDGTEVDEEDYFHTLERNTCFMILKKSDRWIPLSECNYFNKYEKDEVDSSSSHLIRLLLRIQNDIGNLILLGDKELELLSDMDPGSLGDIIQDKVFLKEVKEASGRFLNEKRDAKESLQLLKMYHEAAKCTKKESNSNEKKF